MSGLGFVLVGPSEWVGGEEGTLGAFGGRLVWDGGCGTGSWRTRELEGGSEQKGVVKTQGGEGYLFEEKDDLN